MHSYEVERGSHSPREEETLRDAKARTSGTRRASVPQKEMAASVSPSQARLVARADWRQRRYPRELGNTHTSTSNAAVSRIANLFSRKGRNIS